MTATALRLIEPVTLPVEAGCICPDRFVGLSEEQVSALPLLYGRRRRTLGELFEVDGDGATEIEIWGDLAHVKRIGEGMSQGRITIYGHAGMHLGTRMSGGEILVHGNVDDWAGAGMSGGTLRVKGDAGARLGASHPGQKRGMTGGVILVEGSAGLRVGERMRRGLIAVGGDVAEFAGARMIAGSIVVLGTLGGRAGAGMKRGTIVALGRLDTGLLPTFSYACTFRPLFLAFYLRRLRAWGLAIEESQVGGLYRRYCGDVTALGKGEILVYDQSQ